MYQLITQEELTLIRKRHHEAPINSFYWGLNNRVQKRARQPGLMDPDTSVESWCLVAEYLSDAAMVYAWQPKKDEQLSIWLRNVTLEIARLPERNWQYADFRHTPNNQEEGSLETAHYCWGVSMVYDLAADLFSANELAEIENALRNKGARYCLAWLAKPKAFHNWRCVISSGLARVGAVLQDVDYLQKALEQYLLCRTLFQEDGSYGESLQYGNYAASALTVSYEALRRSPETAQTVEGQLPCPPQYARWAAASYFFEKTISGWGPHPRAHSANFNDSAALFKPSADLLLHIASHAKDSHPHEAGLARWLFDCMYSNCPPDQGPCDRASYGLFNDYGCLTPLYLLNAADVMTPAEAGMPEINSFECGDVLARDSWEGDTILAVHGGPFAPLETNAHRHQDFNSFILCHREERLLVDPGHSCYRSIIRESDITANSHNTLTIQGYGQDLIKSYRKGLNTIEGVRIDMGTQLLIADQASSLKVIGTEISAVFPAPVKRVARFWFLGGSHALFVVDHVITEEAHSLKWNWVLNNRDDLLDWKRFGFDRIVARYGNAGMKLIQCGGGAIQFPAYGHLHDAYHPSPAQLGEGRPGSALIFRSKKEQLPCESIHTHAIAVDSYGGIANWHFKEESDDLRWQGPGNRECWCLQIKENGREFVIEEEVEGQSWKVEQISSGQFALTQT